MSSTPLLCAVLLGRRVPPRIAAAAASARRPLSVAANPAARAALQSLRGLKRRQTTQFGPPKTLRGNGNSLAFGKAFGGRPPNGAPVSRRATPALVQGGAGPRAAAPSLIQGPRRPTPPGPNGLGGRGPASGRAQARPAPSLIQGRPAAAAASPSLVNGHGRRSDAAVNGHKVNGHKVNGHVNGHKVNGHVNGHKVNGHVNGRKVNGLVNGHKVNGHHVNGQTVGTAAGVNGHVLNGAGSPAYTTSLEEPSEGDDGADDPRLFESDLVVVLDMDECLVHSQFLSHQQSSSQLSAPLEDKYRQAESRPAGSPAFNADEEAESIISSNCEYFRVHLPDGDLVHVNKRPNLDEFLRAVCARYETHVFTAAVGLYADPLLDRLDPDGTMFQRRLFRESCTLDSDLGVYVKDLHGVLGGQQPWGQGASSVQEPSVPIVNGDREEMIAKYNEGRVVLVDNNPLSFLAQPSNGILVSNFYDDPKDATLEAVTELLDELDGVEDVRPVLDERFGLSDALGDVVKFSGGGWR